MLSATGAGCILEGNNLVAHDVRSRWNALRNGDLQRLDAKRISFESK